MFGIPSASAKQRPVNRDLCFVPADLRPKDDGHTSDVMRIHEIHVHISELQIKQTFKRIFLAVMTAN